jgi:hypothetical protein
MANYDAGATYDSGIVYDEAPPIIQGKKMAKVKLDLQNKSDSELVNFTEQHITAMTGNAAFATPAPSAASFLTLKDNFKDALEAAGLAEQAWRTAIALKDAARVALGLGFNQRGSYVDQTSNGVETVILTSNLPVRAIAAPIGELPAPIDFLATMGDMEGEIDVAWSRVRGAKSYMVQHSAHVVPRVWSQSKVVTKSQTTITGCPPGELCVFRVAAVGPAGQGPWSDESIKMSP